MDLTTYALLKQQIGNVSSFTEEDAAKLTKVIQDVEELSSKIVNREEFAEMLKSLVDANDNDKIDTIEEIANWIQNSETALSELSDKVALIKETYAKKNDLPNLPSPTVEDENKVISIDENGNYILKEFSTGVVSYNDLTDTPTNVSTFNNDAGYLTQHQDISGKADISSLSNVGLSGNYEDLTNKPFIPVIPSNISAFNNDMGYLTNHQDISGKANISDIPAIPTNLSAFNNDVGFISQHQDISGKVDKNSLANVATSGDYADLSNVPTIPIVPNNISAFTNDLGYINQHQDISSKANAADLSAHISDTEVHITAAERTAWSAKANITDIPSNISSFNNDANYITLNDIPIELPAVTIANAGEFLRVSNLGTWAAANVPSAESEEY